METLFYTAALLFSGLLFTRLVKLVNLPNVTGYLLAGLLIGPCCIRLLPPEALAGMDVVTSAALGFIAFSIGGEFKLSHIRAIGKSALVITCFQALTAVLFVDLTLILAGFPLPLALTLGAIATATAPAATLMVVRQYKAHGELTNTLLPVVAMDDAIGLMVFSVSIAIASAMGAGKAMRFSTVVLAPLLEIVLSLVIGGAVGFVLAFAMRLFHSRANRLMLCIASVMLGVALAKLWGLSDLLLCMSIGAVLVNLRDDADKVLTGMDDWTPPLFLLFFAVSGATLDLAVLPSVGLLGLLYILARSLGKYFGSFAGAAVTKSSKTIRNYLGVTLLPQAGVAIGMAQLAVSALPAYGAKIRAVVLAATLIYELVGPVCTKIALIRAGEIDDPHPRHKRAVPPAAVKKG